MAGQKYIIEDRGIITQPSSFRVTGINKLGVLSGRVDFQLNGSPFSFRSDAPGSWVKLPADQPEWAVANDINDSSVIIGNDGNATKWVNGTKSTLTAPPLPNLHGYGAVGINNSGQIVGNAWVPSPFSGQSDRTQVVTWDAFGNPSAVNISDTRRGSYYATAISENGIIAGGADSQNLVGDSLPWTRATDGTMTFFDLPSDKGVIKGGWLSAVNSSGQGVGLYGTDNGFSGKSAFLVDPSRFGNQAIALGTLGGVNSEAMEINDAGTAVGWSETATNLAAFVWDQRGGMVDMNTLIDPVSTGWTLYQAHAVNSEGWIAGWGRNPDGRNTIFVAKPIESVPEPTSMAAIAVGAALMARRKRKTFRRD